MIAFFSGLIVGGMLSTPIILWLIRRAIQKGITW